MPTKKKKKKKKAILRKAQTSLSQTFLNGFPLNQKNLALHFERDEVFLFMWYNLHFQIGW